MDIEIIGTESLGVRGLCCFIRTRNRRILIDPGLALGYNRHGLLPHPFQVAVGERIRKNILGKYCKSTDLVISHFHGDHIPLANANPYQLSIKEVGKLNPKVRIWTKNPSHFSPVEKERAKSISSILNKNFSLSQKQLQANDYTDFGKITQIFPTRFLNLRNLNVNLRNQGLSFAKPYKNLISAEGKSQGIISFSKAVFHGEAKNNSETVMMTRIEGEGVFVHASDIQLLNKKSVFQILNWCPDIALVGGPPLYLSDKFSRGQFREAWDNAKLLAQEIDILILDHHLMRSYEGVEWIKQLSFETKGKVICAADFMQKPRMLLEARRKDLYKDLPVPEGWHKDYARGKVNTDYYWNLRKRIYKCGKIWLD